MPFLHIALLPLLGATVDNQPVIRFRSARTRALLAFLAVESSHPQARERVAGMLWPDQPETTALHNLSQTLLQLRQALGETDGPGYLLTTRQTIQLNPACCQIDVADIATHLAAARASSAAGKHAAAVHEREQAIRLYRGPLLENFLLRESDLFDEWLLVARAQLHRHILDALEYVTSYYDHHADDQQAVVFARRFVELDMLNEHAHRCLMRALIFTGQRHAALLQYEACRQALERELGVSPTAQTVALWEHIRAGTLQRVNSGAAISTPNGWQPHAQHIAHGAHTVPDRSSFFGRTTELTALGDWLAHQRCRVVAILGLGGIGKTALAAQIAAQVADDYQHVIWRSLLNAPPLEELIGACLDAFGESDRCEPSAPWPLRLDALMAVFHERRCLLVLDNLESILEPGERAGTYRSGYGNYGQLMHRAALEHHASCVLLTSREQPQDIGRLVDAGAPIRCLRLDGLTPEAGAALLRARHLAHDQAATVVAHYSGNPLAIELVAATIHELFAGDVAAFLREDIPIFDDIRAVLDQQYSRLSQLERDLIIWLAIERAPVTLDHLQFHLANREPAWAIIEALRSLQRRSLIELRHAQATLQHVVMEYVTDVLIASIVRECETGALDLFARHALVCTQAAEYVRQSQIRLVLAPPVRQLAARLGQAALVARLRALLGGLHSRAEWAASYAAGNALNMLVYLGADLRDLDLSGLAVWQADLRGVRAAINFTDADLRGSMFTENMRAITSVAFSPDGELLVAGSTDGTLLLWHVGAQHLVRTYTGHTALVNAVAFSPSGTLLASGAMDGTIRLWPLDGDQNAQTLVAHTAGVLALAFNAAGVLASSGYDGAVRLWDGAHGTLAHTIDRNAVIAFGLAWSPDGTTLAIAGQDGLISLWQARTASVIRTLTGHSDFVLSVAYHADGRLIASSSGDRTVRVWDAETGQLVHVFAGHTNVVAAVAWSPTSLVLASAAWDHTVRLWDVHAMRLLAVLEGHTSHVSALAFNPTSGVLASGGYDQTVRLWDADSHQLLVTWRGHTTWIWSLAWMPDGATIASAHHDQAVRLWDVQRGIVRTTLYGHTNEVVTVAISPDGATLASAGNDRTVRLWDAETGHLIRAFRGHTTALYQVAYSPDGQLVASADLGGMVCVWNIATGEQRRWQHGQRHSAAPVAFGRHPATDNLLLAIPSDNAVIQLHDLATGQPVVVLRGHRATVTALAWSNDGTMVASSSWDGTVRLWDTRTAHTIHTLTGHTNYVMAIAISRNGEHVASGSLDGTVRVWDVSTGAAQHVLRGHSGGVFAVAMSPDGVTLVSGSDDETIRLWNIQTGAWATTLRAAGPYAGMNITRITNLTEAQRTALTTLGATDNV